MLKIKDDLELTELKKYGFEFDKFYNLYAKKICDGRRGQSFDILIGKNRVILGYAEGADGDGEESPIEDTLYDLIKDDLVEKVK